MKFRTQKITAHMFRCQVCQLHTAGRPWPQSRQETNSISPLGHWHNNRHVDLSTCYFSTTVTGTAAIFWGHKYRQENR